MKVSSEWFIGVEEPEEKEERIEELRRARNALLILQKILTKRLAEKNIREVTLDSYDSPSWAYREADIIGAKRELRLLLSLINPIVPDQGNFNG